MNRANLEKLASYLEALPAGYEGFSMREFFEEEYRRHGNPRFAPLAGRCGTIACAVGHGPAAGIPIAPEDDCWIDYSDRVFALTEKEWRWCFDGSWANVDNTPHGAAKRIRHLLLHGIPDDADRQLYRRAPYLFTPQPDEAYYD